MKKPIQDRTASQEAQGSFAKSQAPADCGNTPEKPTKPVSFARDISPIFKPFQGPMAWRLDLTDYNAVLGNAELIYGLISSKDSPMPPPPFPPLTQEQIETFEQWMKQDCPP